MRSTTTRWHDAWPVDNGNPPRYTKARPPLYTNVTESGLSSPAVVNDVVFMSTTYVSLYALAVGDGTLLFEDRLGEQTGGFNGGYGYCMGPAVCGNYVVAGALVFGGDGGVLRIYGITRRCGECLDMTMGTLGLDNIAVAFALGPLGLAPRRMLLLGLAFGLAEAGMTLLGATALGQAWLPAVLTTDAARAGVLATLAVAVIGLAWVKCWPAEIVVQPMDAHRNVAAARHRQSDRRQRSGATAFHLRRS